MNRTKTKAIVFALGILFGMVVRANADPWDQRTIFTFSGPVEIPGQVLNAGTYVFKLADSASDRNIVQVFSKNENHLFGTFLTIPDYRLKPARRLSLSMSGQPDLLKRRRPGFIPAKTTATTLSTPKSGPWHWPRPTTSRLRQCRLNWRPIRQSPPKPCRNLTWWR